MPIKLPSTFTRSLCSIAAIGSLSAAPSAFAATLYLVEPPVAFPMNGETAVPVDLTAEGTLDWAYWKETANPLANTVAPTNRKLGGSLISSAFVLNDGVGANGVLRGSPSATTVGRYSFSNGSTLTSGTNVPMAGLLFNSKLGAGSEGDGFTLQITGDPEAERVVRLYLGGYGATGELKLTLAGVTTIVDTSQKFAVGTKGISIYTVRFQPNSISDLLTVSYTAIPTSVPTNTPPIDVNAHVGLEAVTVAAIPEPGSALLLGVGAIAVAGRRRRRA